MLSDCKKQLVRTRVLKSPLIVEKGAGAWRSNRSWRRQRLRQGPTALFSPAAAPGRCPPDLVTGGGCALGGTAPELEVLGSGPGFAQGVVCAAGPGIQPLGTTCPCLRLAISVSSELGCSFSPAFLGGFLDPSTIILAELFFFLQTIHF